MKSTYVKPDARNRVSLTKLTKDLHTLYKAYMEDDKIILEPVKEVSEHERWVLDPANKEIVEEIKRRLSEKTEGIYRGSFKKYIDEE
jgi:hypothetical protein